MPSPFMESHPKVKQEEEEELTLTPPDPGFRVYGLFRS